MRGKRKKKIAFMIQNFYLLNNFLLIKNLKTTFDFFDKLLWRHIHEKDATFEVETILTRFLQTFEQQKIAVLFNRENLCLISGPRKCHTF